MSPSPARQRGVALITALLVVALVTVAAVSLTAAHQLDLRRAATSQSFGQAHLHAHSAEALAAELLGYLHADPEVAAAIARGSCTSPPAGLEIEGAFVTVYLEDLHCRINLNNLADAEDTETEEGFVRLVEALNRDDSAVRIDPEALVAALREWIDPEVEDDWYSWQDPPYRPANQPLASASELLLVRGVDEAVYRALEPYVTALPATGTALNTTAAPELLREAFQLPDAGDMDTDEQPGWGAYTRLSMAIELDERVHRRCTVIHGPSGRIVLRRLRAC